MINGCRFHNESFLLTGRTEFSKSRLKKMRATDTYKAAIIQSNYKSSYIIIAHRAETAKAKEEGHLKEKPPPRAGKT